MKHTTVFALVLFHWAYIKRDKKYIQNGLREITMYLTLLKLQRWNFSHTKEEG